MDQLTNQGTAKDAPKARQTQPSLHTALLSLLVLLSFCAPPIPPTEPGLPDFVPQLVVEPPDDTAGYFVGDSAAIQLLLYPAYVVRNVVLTWQSECDSDTLINIPLLTDDKCDTVVTRLSLRCVDTVRIAAAIVLSDRSIIEDSIKLFVTGVAPRIIGQSAVSVSCLLGARCTLYVQAAGTPPLTYSWTHGGTTSPGAVDDTLLLGPVSYSDSGRYECRVSSRWGSATSASIAVHVFEPAAAPVRVHGWARLQGDSQHSGIRVSFLSALDTQVVATASNGYVFADLRPATYTIQATDTLRAVFAQATQTFTVQRGLLSATFDTLILADRHPPVAGITFPASDDTLKVLVSRLLTVSGTASDTGAGIVPDSVRVVVDGSRLTSVSVSGSTWQAVVQRVGDGPHMVQVTARDKAGNSSATANSRFWVNCKTVELTARVSSDSVYLRNWVHNARPGLRALLWDLDNDLRPGWDDSTIAPDTIADVAFRLPYPVTPRTGSVVVQVVDSSGMVVRDTAEYVVTTTPQYPDWRDGIVYYALIDRFADGGTSNSSVGGVDASADFQGGDLPGMRGSIAYLQNLGVGTLVISPPFANPDTLGIDPYSSTTVAPFQGKWQVSTNCQFTNGVPNPTPIVDRRFGSVSDLRDLVSRLHEYSMKAVLEYPLKHVHISSPAYQQRPDYFYQNSLCQGNWADCRSRWLSPTLPAIDQSNPAARAWSLDLAAWWLSEFRFDGVLAEWGRYGGNVGELRQKVDNLVPRTSGSRFAIFTAAEFEPADLNALTPYLDPGRTYDGVFNRAYRAAACSTFLNGGMSVRDFAAFADENDRRFPSNSLMLNGLGNLETPRAINIANREVGPGPWATAGMLQQPISAVPYERMSLAFAVLLTAPGLPFVLYGDEIGLAGGSSPDNCRFMPSEAGLSMYQMTLLQKVQRLTSIRTQHTVLSRGTRSTVSVDNETWVYRMSGANSLGAAVVVAVNRDDSPHDVSIPSGNYADLLTGTTFTGGTRSLPARSYAIFEQQP